MYQAEAVMNDINPIDYTKIKASIITVRGFNVLIDSDIAKVYGVETKRINEAVEKSLDERSSEIPLKVKIIRFD